MTKRERAQVVELLRCAADAMRPHGIMGMHWASERLRPRAVVVAAAWAAVKRAKRLLRVPPGACSCTPIDPLYHLALLEAAARVEEGSYP